jgi:hypothetical protein
MLRRLRLAALVVTMGLAGLAIAAAGPRTTLVSVNAAGTDSGNGHSRLSETVDSGRLSSNGQRVLFESDAKDLVANDRNDAADLFVRDLKFGTTTLVSVNTAGTGSGNGAGTIGLSAITPNGRFVVFNSDASDLVGNDTNGATDVFVRDLTDGTTTLVSVNSAGTGSGNGVSLARAITPDGRFVAFSSNASDLVANDTNGRRDAFVRDLKAGTTSLVSVNSAGTGGGNGTSDAAAITPNGRFVVFGSDASDLVANDTNNTLDVFVRDLKRGTTTLVSANAAGTATGNGLSQAREITPNGRFVPFESIATDLVANDTNDQEDVFVRDLKTGTTTLVNINVAGTASADGASFLLGSGAISSNGQFVAFYSEASDVVTTPNGNGYGGDLFVRDLKNGTTTLASINYAGTASGNTGSPSSMASLTPNGRFLVFDSIASDLIANDTNGFTDDVFVRDLKLGTTTLVSVNTAGTDSGDYGSGATFYQDSGLAITPSGRFVAFDSSATDLVGSDVHLQPLDDVFVRQLR